jgi:GT2 family glycosyltransferase
MPSSSAQFQATLVVVAYHRPHELQALVERLTADRAGDHGLGLVVVNVESDPEIRSVAAGAGATIVPIPGNPGYAACVNAGVAVAESDLVVFSNDDIEVDTATVLGLAAVVGSGDADVVVPRVVASDGSPVPTCQALPDLGHLVSEWMLLPQEPVPWLARLRVEKWRRPEGRERVDAASAIMVATTRSLLIDEPLPEDYFMYFEESDWFWRLRDRGAVTLYCPDFVVAHSGGLGVVNPFKSRLQARNAVRVIRRRAGRAQSVAAYAVVIAWQLRLLATALVRWALGRDQAEMVPARLAGLQAALAAWREI